MQGRVSRIEFSWARTATIAQGIDAGSLGSLGDCFESEVSQPEDNDNRVIVDDTETASFVPFASESENVTEEVSLAYQLRGRVTSIGATVSHFEQERLASAGRETANRIQLTLSRAVSRFMQPSFTVSATEGEARVGDDQSDKSSSQQALLSFQIRL